MRILYPTDDELMVLNMVDSVKSFSEIIEGLPESSEASLKLLKGLIHRHMIYAIINAYVEVYGYKPLKINETVLG